MKVKRKSLNKGKFVCALVLKKVYVYQSLLHGDICDKYTPEVTIIISV